MQMVLIAQGIDVEHRHIAQPGELLAGQLKQPRVDLHGDDVGGVGGQQGRQGSRAGADFQHDILRPNGGRPVQQPQQVQIDEKVLPMTRLR